MQEIEITQQLTRTRNYMFHFKEGETNWAYDGDFPAPDFVDRRSEGQFLEDLLEEIRRKFKVEPEEPEVIDGDLYIATFKKNGLEFRYSFRPHEFDLIGRYNEYHGSEDRRQIDWCLFVNSQIFGPSTLPNPPEPDTSREYYYGMNGRIETQEGSLLVKPVKQHLNTNPHINYKDVQDVVNKLDFSHFGVLSRDIGFAVRMMTTRDWYYTLNSGFPTSKVKIDSQEPAMQNAIRRRFRDEPDVIWVLNPNISGYVSFKEST